MKNIKAFMAALPRKTKPYYICARISKTAAVSSLQNKKQKPGTTTTTK